MIRIKCACGHIGLVAAEILPRDLQCSRCGDRRHVAPKDGQRVMSKLAFTEWLLGYGDAELTA